jgi:hypothetical protein
MLKMKLDRGADYSEDELFLIFAAHRLVRPDRRFAYKLGHDAPFYVNHIEQCVAVTLDALLDEEVKDTIDQPVLGFVKIELPSVQEEEREAGSSSRISSRIHKQRVVINVGNERFEDVLRCPVRPGDRQVINIPVITDLVPQEMAEDDEPVEEDQLSGYVVQVVYRYEQGIVKGLCGSALRYVVPIRQGVQDPVPRVYRKPAHPLKKVMLGGLITGACIIGGLAATALTKSMLALPHAPREKKEPKKSNKKATVSPSAFPHEFARFFHDLSSAATSSSSSSSSVQKVSR